MRFYFNCSFKVVDTKAYARFCQTEPFILATSLATAGLENAFTSEIQYYIGKLIWHRQIEMEDRTSIERERIPVEATPCEAPLTSLRPLSHPAADRRVFQRFSSCVQGVPDGVYGWQWEECYSEWKHCTLFRWHQLRVARSCTINTGI